ncbi:MAG TPA: nuclear transport factor 2 family protein [Marmoricola sp.]
MDRAELESAFADFQAAVADIAADGDWGRFADLFTQDAEYVEHAYGTFRGRDEIRPWIIKTMTTFPGSDMVGFPVAWSVLDPELGRVVCEIRNLMRDPGDGSVHEASNITILDYAGGGLWRREEDVYNPQKFLDLTRTWGRVAREHGTLGEDGLEMLAALEKMPR